MKTKEGLGKLQVSEEQVMVVISAIMVACERHNDKKYLDQMFMSLGILYGYEPKEFFDRLANSTLKMADEMGEHDNALVVALRDDSDVQKGKPVNLASLL